MLPVYYAKVAGATLESEPTATKYWSLTLSISLLIVAVLAPVLGTVADVMRGKKRLLAIFMGLGVLGTGLLVLVGTGDWFLASAVFILGRVGFAAANVFYDSLLPHVAREEDRDRVSSFGYAIGYLGGGLLLAVNVAMIMLLGDVLGTWATRLCFLSVAVWWVVFSVPLFLRVPEPPSATVRLASGESVLGVSFRRLAKTLRSIREHRQLFRFLIAFLVYNDGIGTIIGVAAIYGVELGFSATELILALLLVQFAGVPFTLVFGRIPTAGASRRGACLAFVLANVVALPIVGIAGARLLAPEQAGVTPPIFEARDGAVGQGEHELGEGGRLRFHGRRVRLTHAAGPSKGRWKILVDGRLALGEDGEPVEMGSARSPPRSRFEETVLIDAGSAGLHLLEVEVPPSEPGEPGRATGGAIEVLPAERESDLLLVFGLLLLVQVMSLAFALAFGERLFTRAARSMDARRTILVALIAYGVISLWGFALDAVIEFWFLAWMVAVVQGGSQALSRSLYASMSPPERSGEFFGLYSVMAKFSAILGPLVFVASVTLFESSRPALIGIFLFFVVGGWILRSVDVEEGRRAAVGFTEPPASGP